MHTHTYSNLIHTDVLQAQAAGRSPLGGWELLLRMPVAARVARVVLRSYLRRKLQNLTRQYVSMALVYTGAKTMLSQADPQMMCGPDTDAVIDGLEQVERDLLAHREQLLTLRSQLGGSFDADMIALIEANADAFEAAQALRWELMELQADADIAAGRVEHFATAQAAADHLRSLIAA